jgi:hypothetical protein
MEINKSYHLAGRLLRVSAGAAVAGIRSTSAIIRLYGKQCLKFIPTVYWTVKNCWQSRYLLRFQLLTATSMKRAVFWDIAPCSLEELTDISEVLTAFIIRLSLSFL